MVLQKVAVFTDGPDQYGMIVPIEINFTQIRGDAAHGDGLPHESLVNGLAKVVGQPEAAGLEELPRLQQRGAAGGIAGGEVHHQQLERQLERGTDLAQDRHDERIERGVWATGVRRTDLLTGRERHHVAGAHLDALLADDVGIPGVQCLGRLGGKYAVGIVRLDEYGEEA